MTLKLAERLATSQTWLDGVSDRLQPLVRDAVAGTGRRGADLLDGVWLGAPLHPALTDVPVGALTAAIALDGAALATGSRAVERKADGALAISVAVALAAAATGLSDWRYMRGDTRRLAAAHGLLNVVGVAFNATSLGLRLAGRRRAGQVSSALGFLVAGTAAHFGGELSFGMGVRVNQAQPGAGPTEFTPVLDESQLDGTSMHRVDAAGEAVLVTRSTSGEICAIANTCSHFGGPLAEGEREGDVVVCPWHGSRFDVRTGDVAGGPAVFPQPRFEARARDGKVEIRRAE
ncbi:MAG: Rieske 2Fe-2S domain-containing protein [Solirubrobacteraceae bacterium]